jgi:hypothetical protein
MFVRIWQFRARADKGAEFRAATITPLSIGHAKI